MWQQTLNIWRREMMDFLRDRKSLRTALLTPIVMALFFALFSAFFSNIGGAADADEQLEMVVVAAIGEQNLPLEFVEKLHTLAVKLEPYGGSSEQLATDIRNEEVALGLIVPDDFVQRIEENKSARPIILEASSTSITELGSDNRLVLAFEQYGDELLAERLTARGIEPDLLTPIVIETRDVMFAEDSNRASRAGSVIAAFYIPLLLGMTIGGSGVSTAIDTTAGERDRGTLESLLLTPAGERGIFIGKTLKVLTMTLIPTVLSFVTFALISQYITPLIWPDYTPLEISPAKIAFSILLCLPFMLLVGLVQMIMALRAKSVDGAQSTAPVFTFLAMAPMGAGAFMQPDSPLLHLIPGFGAASVISKMVIAKPYLIYLPYVLISTVVLAAVAVWFGARMFDRERLLYEG